MNFGSDNKRVPPTLTAFASENTARYRRAVSAPWNVIGNARDKESSPEWNVESTRVLLCGVS